MLGLDGAKRQVWAQTSDQLAEIVLNADREGFNVYHACSAFEAKVRKARGAVGSKAFWLDVDAGESKPYPDMDAARVAVEAFQAGAGLPSGSFVASGSGLHVYWFAENAWTADEWARGATRLKELCRQHGLRADPTRTADAASVLRPPGTTNRKGNVVHREVRLLSFGGIHPNVRFEALFDRAPDSKPAHAPKPKLNGIAAAAANIYPEDPADANLIADRCQQIRAFRDLQGVIPEPQWYSAMAVVGSADRGPEIIHQWSSGDPRYNRDDTERKLVRALSLSGPTTCAHFGSINPGGCAGCPFAGRVTTPLQLGRGAHGGSTGVPQHAAEVREGGSNDNLVGGDIGRGDADPAREPAEARPPLPLGFQWGIGGQLIFLSETPKGEQQAVTVSQYPIHLKSVTVGELRTDSFGLSFHYWLPKQGWMDFTISARTLGGPNAIAAMMDKGVTIESPELFRKYIRDSMNLYYAEQRLQTQFEQCGWKRDNEAFLIGTRLYTGAGVQEQAASAEIQERGKALRIQPHANLAKWTEAASIFAAAGLEMHLYALLASFAAPLMKFLSADEGGGIVSCVSADSGRGKTTIVEAVASVWGELDGTRLLNTDTRNAKGLVLGTVGNLPMVFDEFDAKDPDHTLEFVQTFTTGRDKLRATQEGNLKAQGAKWQTILVSASNRSLVDSILAAKNTPQTYRILEMGMELNDILKTRGDWVRSTMRANAGVAGDKYIRYLVTPGVLPQVIAGMNAYRTRIEANPWYKSEMRYWVRIHVAIAFAALIVEKLGLIQFSAERIVRWGETFLSEQQIQDDDTSLTPQSVARSVDILSSFMLEKRSEILVMPSAWKAHTKMVPYFTPPHKISGRYNNAEQVLVLAAAAIRDYVTRERRFPWKEFMRNLKAYNILITTSKVVLSAGTDIAGAQVNVLELDLRSPLLSNLHKPVDPTAKVIDLPSRTMG